MWLQPLDWLWGTEVRVMSGYALVSSVGLVTSIAKLYLESSSG